MIEAFLSRAVLAGIRVGALMTFAPFFSNVSLPNPVKVALTMLLTFMLVPVYASGTPAAPDLGGWLSMALGELALGIIIGFATQFVIDGMSLAGQLASFQFGFSLVNIVDPNSQVEVTVLTTFYELAALLIFMQLGVHRWLLRAVAMSFRMIPLGGAAAVPFPATELLRMAGAMWLIGAEIAFPVIVATLLLDLTVGFVAKASPQFPALFFGLSAKFLLGLSVLYGTVAFWPHTLDRYFLHQLTNLESLLAFHR